MSELCRVLILDDEFIMRQGMKHMMDWAKEGFTEYVNKIRIRHAKELLEHGAQLFLPGFQKVYFGDAK